MAELDGRHVVVTGAGTGIGLAIARRVSREGASVTLLARDGDRLRAASLSLVTPSHVAECDIRQRKAVDRAFDAAVTALGPIHALVAAAGTGGSNEPRGDDRFDDLVAKNLVGTYRVSRQRSGISPPDRSLVTSW